MPSNDAMILEPSRVYSIAGLTIICMECFGVIAYLAAHARHAFRGTTWFWDGAILVLFISAIVGVIAIPWTISFLWDTQLRSAFRFVFISGALITGVSAGLFPFSAGLLAAIPALLGVVSLSAVAARVYPDPTRNADHCCEACGYDLSHCRPPGCPECGHGRTQGENSP